MSDPKTHLENVRLSAEKIRAAAGDLAPKLAIMLGSGLGGLSAKVESPVILSYQDLPGFPIPTVPCHAGKLLIGRLSGVPVFVLSGRKHFYETHDPYPLKTLIRAVHAAGADTLFLSNAAGSLREHIKVTELMLITDHINFQGCNPLVGHNESEFGPLFVPLTDAWDKVRSAAVKEAAKAEGVALHEGVYVAFRGPCFETPAEIRMAQGWGADAVGMSSVPDCMIARHCGLKVVGVSCITNMGAGLSDENLTYEHAIEMASRGASAFERLVLAAVPRLASISAAAAAEEPPAKKAKTDG